MANKAKEKLVQSIRDAVDPEKARELEILLDLCFSPSNKASASVELNKKLHGEITDVADYILETKRELAALRPDEIKSDFLPTATDELEAIVGATEAATNSILAGMERLEDNMDKLDDATAETFGEVITGVYEACSFQDITGQRISRVVNALQHVENKVDVLLGFFGDDLKNGQASPKSPKRARGNDRPDEDLMNGPQMPGKGVSQDDIDALFD